MQHCQYIDIGFLCQWLAEKFKKSFCDFDFRKSDFKSKNHTKNQEWKNDLDKYQNHRCDDLNRNLNHFRFKSPSDFPNTALEFYNSFN